jgi:hypothetical protein
MVVSVLPKELYLNKYYDTIGTVMELIRYRDAGMNTYTWFYVNDKKHCISPFFNSEEEAKAWLDEVFDTEAE